MSGLSRVAFGTLLQLTSSDLESAFRLPARDMLDALRYLASERAVVLGGLKASSAPTGVAIAPGMLLAPYGGGAGAPAAALDSPFVLGRLESPVTLALPAPVADTWRLVQARALEQEVTGDRLKFDPATGEQTPVAVVVQRLQSIEFGYKQDTLAVPAPDPGWVPIAVVRSLAGTTEPAGDAISDVRPLQSATEPELGTERFESHDYAIVSRGGLAAQLWVDVVVVDRKGRRLSAQGTFALSAIAASGVTLPKGTWQYLYLAPFGGGRLVLSDVPPSTQGSRSNSTAITPNASAAMPAVPAGDATCIGALRTDDQTDGHVVAQHCVRGNHALASLADYIPLSVLNPPVNSLLPVTFLPRNARRARFAFRATAPGTGLIFSPSASPGMTATTSPAVRADAVLPGTGGSVSLTPLPLAGVNHADIALAFPAGTLLLQGVDF
jgi:hypothetical protein